MLCVSTFLILNYWLIKTFQISFKYLTPTVLTRLEIWAEIVQSICTKTHLSVNQTSIGLNPRPILLQTQPDGNLKDSIKVAPSSSSKATSLEWIDSWLLSFFSYTNNPPKKHWTYIVHHTSTYLWCEYCCLQAVSSPWHPLHLSPSATHSFTLMDCRSWEPSRGL